MTVVSGDALDMVHVAPLARLRTSQWVTRTQKNSKHNRQTLFIIPFYVYRPHNIGTLNSPCVPFFLWQLPRPMAATRAIFSSRSSSQPAPSRPQKTKNSTPVVPHVELARPLVPDVVGGNLRVVQTISGDLRARGGAGAKAERA